MPKSPAPAKPIWRISDNVPMGAWVDSGSTSPPRPPRIDLPEVSSGSWITSSYDLLHGTDIVEGDDTTVPAELFDELFGTKPGAIEPSGK
jgi:hypothetical protein